MSTCVVLLFYKKKMRLTKDSDSSLGAFTKIWNQSSWLYFTVSSIQCSMWGLHSSQPWAMIVQQHNANYLSPPNYTSISPISLSFLWPVSLDFLQYILCFHKAVFGVWLQWKFMHSLITSAHGSPTLYILGKKHRCWICSICSTLASVTHIHKRKTH